MALGVQIATFVFTGTAILDETFGFFAAASAVQIQRLQISAQQGAVGGNVKFELVDEDGNALGGSITLINGTNHRDVGLSAPITLLAHATVRAKITEVDLGIAGYFTLTLIGATAQGNSPPVCNSCCCC